MEWTRIGNIENYYGGVHVSKHDGKYYWLVENYTTDFSDPDVDEIEEIPEYLFKSLIRFNKSKE